MAGWILVRLWLKGSCRPGDVIESAYLDPFSLNITLASRSGFLFWWSDILAMSRKYIGSPDHWREGSLAYSNVR